MSSFDPKYLLIKDSADPMHVLEIRSACKGVDMILKFGDVEVEIQFDNPPSKSTLENLVRELGDSKCSFRIKGAEDKPIGKLKKNGKIKIVTQSKPQVNPLEDVALLKGAGFTNSTIAMIANKVLSVPAKGDTIVDNWVKIRPAIDQWFERKLEDEGIWGLIIAPISVPRMGALNAVVGINKKNQNIVLALEPNKLPAIFDALIERGLKEKAIQFVMFSLQLGSTSDVKSYFPKAKIGRDWQEVIDMIEDEEEKAELQTAMLTPDVNEAKAILRAYNQPSELLTYYQFDKKLWRGLRSATTIYRIERELKTRTKTADNDSKLELISKFTLLRLQYHWRKYPLDSDLLKNMKYIQLQELE